MLKQIRCQIGWYNDYFYTWITVATIVFIVLESLWPGSVRAYLNLAFWLLFWTISATLKVVLSNKNS
ncbi:MAG TPA: hypothetical protein PLT32_01965 [bacterium]|nr:hypothetical protein [bacterium]